MSDQMRRRVKLKDVCVHVTVGHVGTMAKHYVEEGIPFLRSQNIAPFSLDLSNLKYIDTSFHKKLKKSALLPGDVVVVRTGYPGTACVIPSNFPTANCADLVILRPSSDLDGRYLAAMFNSALGRSVVSGSLVGVAQQHFNVGVAKEMEVDLPAIETQHRIADILSAYDDLIENNTRRIKILEEMAQRIYREWFVRFRFPGHENVPLVPSDLGPIPQGWSVEALADICERLQSGGTPSRKVPELWNPPTVDWFKTKELQDSWLFHSEEKISTEGLSRSSAKLFPAGTVVMAIYAAPTVGRLGILDQAATFNQAACGLVPDLDKVSTWFLFHKLHELRVHFNSLAQGAAQQNISGEKVKGCRTIVPSPLVVQDFDRIAEPVMNLVRNLARSSNNLRTTRDLLLPKLISGEISVEAAEDAGAELMEQTA